MAQKLGEVGILPNPNILPQYRIEDMLKRFKFEGKKEGTIFEVRSRSHYVKLSDKKRRAKIEAKRQAKKSLRKQMQKDY